MPSPSSRSVIARLRASTRLVAWVLLVFVMKIGMVAACTTHDLEDLRLGGKAAAAASTAVVDNDTATSDGDTPNPAKHGNGVCVDCSCHHAAALLPDTLNLAFPPTDSELTRFFLQVRHAVPRRELRPPIA